ncbi:MAG: hypothetical protein HN390_04960 [Anaerolineae bacterium]|jgi:hypothetical protein|nr:hypothetical protein [Anaerolineae bacterium]MBT7189674.1 hypothetical protein [Anaerolineae bacterium]
MQAQTKTHKILGIVIILVQLFDIFIHAASDQLEPLRVISNLIIVAWVVVLLAGKLGEKIKSASLGSIGTYLGLNLIFLALEGLTNANTGAPRSMLFLLVILTTALSSVLFTQLKKQLTT